MRALVVLPTFGERPSLGLALESLKPHPPCLRVEIRTPSALTPEFCSSAVSVTVVSDGGQREAILNAWEEGLSEGYDWFSWLNDDDFALPSYRSLLECARDVDATEKKVIYGDWLYVSDQDSRYIRAPRSIAKWHLAYGACYIPGVLPFVSGGAVRHLLTNKPVSRDSFDYAFWLSLAAAGADFRHCGTAVSAWRDHDGSRTQAEPDVGTRETEALRAEHHYPWTRPRMIRQTVSALARLDAYRRAHST